MDNDENPTELVLVPEQESTPRACVNLPSMVAAAGGNARFAYEEFLSGLDSPHTARAYRKAVERFLKWCEHRGMSLRQITPGAVSEYIRSLPLQGRSRATVSAPPEVASKPTRKLHLAALRHFFDKAVERHAIMLNPTASVRGPRYAVTEGKTPAIHAKQVRDLLDSIDLSHPKGLRDRAIIATLVFTAARVGAVATLARRGYFSDGRQFYFRFDEKGGKQRVIPVRHDLQVYVEEYLAQVPTSIADAPMFLTMEGRSRRFTSRAMSANDMLRMVKRRLRDAGLPASQLCCHSFRAGTATNLLEQGIDPAEVQFLLGHADPRTTRLYDRRQLAVSRNIVERIAM